MVAACIAAWPVVKEGRPRSLDRNRGKRCRNNRYWRVKNVEHVAHAGGRLAHQVKPYRNSLISTILLDSL